MENEMNLVISELNTQKIFIKNKDEIINELKENLVKYDRVLTEDDLREGKEDKAKLNKLVKIIEDKRKEIKKAVMVPYDEIEKDFKNITNLISEAVNKLDKQVKTFEEEKKKEKQEQINELLKLNTTEIEFNNERWLNSTYKLVDIEEEIKTFVIKFNQNMELLKDEDIVIKDFYKRTQDISATLLEKKRFEDLRKKEEEIKLQKEKEDNELTKEILEIVKPRTIAEAFPDEIEISTQYVLEMNLTRIEALKLKKFLIENNIEYKIKEEN